MKTQINDQNYQNIITLTTFKTCKDNLKVCNLTSKLATSISTTCTYKFLPPILYANLQDDNFQPTPLHNFTTHNSQLFEVHNLKSILNIKFVIATYKFTNCHTKAQISQINSTLKFQNRIVKNTTINQKFKKVKVKVTQKVIVR